VKGLDTFKAHFAGAEHQYVLIGGAACDIVLSEVGLDARVTKDLDIVLCIEAVDNAFFQRLWDFIEAGGYTARERSSGDKEFYRFHKPTSPDHPYMLELFSRKPDGVDFPEGAVLTPMPAADEIMSLSAILLDDNYYALLQEQKRVVDGVSVLDEKALIPFKAYAHIDLRQRKEAGDAVSAEDVKKHRADVFRLAQLLPADAAITLAPTIASDLERFLVLVSDDTDVKTFAGVSLEEAVSRLKRAYGLA
jgi:hypothetical protein